jgi:hypothetical protein
MRRSLRFARGAHTMSARPSHVALARASRGVLTAVLLLATACGEGFSPTIDTIAGPYTATQLTLTQNGQTTIDLLATAPR